MIDEELILEHKRKMSLNLTPGKNQMVITGGSIQVDESGRISNPGGSLLESYDDTYRSAKTIHSQKSSVGDVPKKEGHKWNAETGEFEKLTEEEINRMKLVEELERCEKRMQEL